MTLSGMRQWKRAVTLIAAIDGIAALASADTACLSEASAIEAVLASPPASVAPGDLDQAGSLLNQLLIACAEGGALSDESVQSIVAPLRALLGLE